MAREPESGLLRLRAFPRLVFAEEPRRVLILAPEEGAELLAATPVLETLLRRFSRAEIELVAGGEAAELLRGGPLAERLVAPAGALARRSQGGYDLAVVLARSWRAAWLALRAGARRRLGHAGGGRGWLLTDRLIAARARSGPLPQPLVRRHADLAGLCDAIASPLRPRLYLDPGCEERLDGVLEELGLPRDGRLCLVAPVEGRLAGWPEERLAAALAQLVERFGLQIVLRAGPELCGTLCEQARVPVAAGAAALRDPELLKALVERSALVLTADPVLHQLALAFEVPVVWLSAGRDPRSWGANLERTRVMRVAVGCGPCERKRCALGQRCSAELGVAEVVAACGLALEV